VYYVENSILDPARHHHNQSDLVVTNSEPNILEDPEGPSLFGSAVAATSTPSNVNLPNNLLLAKPRYEKNVNIDAFKLGMEEASQTSAGACGRSTPSAVAGRSTPMSGACGSVADDADAFDVLPLKKPLNVNMFDEEDETPVRGGNSYNRKINKPKINNLLNNSVVAEEEDDDDDVSGGKFGVDNPFGVDDNDGDDDDELAIVKMSNYLGSYDKK